MKSEKAGKKDGKDTKSGKGSKAKAEAGTKDGEVIVTRIIDAPREKVFKAWTEPDKIKNWWGPKGFTAPSIKIDLKKGGKYLYAMEDPSGKVFWSGGVIKEVDAPKRIIVSDYFSDDKGNKMDPVEYGMSEDFPKETVMEVKFEEEERDRTRISIISDLPESQAAREAIRKSGADTGWNQSLDKLQEFVEGGSAGM